MAKRAEIKIYIYFTAASALRDMYVCKCMGVCVCVCVRMLKSVAGNKKQPASGIQHLFLFWPKSLINKRSKWGADADADANPNPNAARAGNWR